LLSEFEIRIRDEGIGMSPSQLQTLFQPYSQATTKTSLKYSGSGLGRQAKSTHAGDGECEERAGGKCGKKTEQAHVALFEFVSVCGL
jgi:C4-dicarboxylate-specific signal transduction histidine kinase